MTTTETPDTDVPCAHGWPEGCEYHLPDESVEWCDVCKIRKAMLDAIPDGWAKLDGQWVQITSDGVGYGEFDRVRAGGGRD